MRFAPLLLAVGVAICCAEREPRGEPIRLTRAGEVSESAWSQLATKTVYFAHQSLGEDIVDGMREVMARNPAIRMTIREAVSPARLEPGTFAHGKVGRNFDYRSKLDEFSAVMDNGLGNEVDVAFLKFCFVDVMPTTDIEQMFRDYTSTMADLETRYPRTTFVHLTEPLTWHLSGTAAAKRRLKDLVKATVGLPGYGRFYDNRPRNELNEMLRSRYGGREPLFDIAAVESARGDGSRATYLDGDITRYAMVPGFTEDGGHLNAAGRVHVAEQLLIFLAELVSRDPAVGGPGP